ncbi:DUF2961 domain-containing protein [bacterium]|nr:MAG: DUF2961 domain-containing protein [bacterium]
MATETALYSFPSGVETRWYTPENPTGERAGACKHDDGRKRRPSVSLKDGERLTLAETSGTSGIVRRIWITIAPLSPEMLRGLRLEAFWDGSETPAISVPLGDFFGHTLGRMITFENAFFSSPEGRSFNCCLPMPFRTGMRLVVTNDSGGDLNAMFYEVNVTLGDDHPEDALYLHALWRRENPTTPLRDYEILPRVSGRGRFLGAFIGVKADTGRYAKSWWGEGEVKIFLDGDARHATLCGTGTEDYIGTGWGQNHYAHLYQGCHLADHEAFEYGFYRFHAPDPVYFHQEIRVTIQQIGCWDPTSSLYLKESGETFHWGEAEIDMEQAVQETPFGLFERQDDWSSCAFLYLDRPAPLP